MAAALVRVEPQGELAKGSLRRLGVVGRGMAAQPLDGLPMFLLFQLAPAGFDLRLQALTPLAPRRLFGGGFLDVQAQQGKPLLRLGDAILQDAPSRAMR